MDKDFITLESNVTFEFQNLRLSIIFHRSFYSIYISIIVLFSFLVAFVSIAIVILVFYYVFLTSFLVDIRVYIFACLHNIGPINIILFAPHQQVISNPELYLLKFISYMLACTLIILLEKQVPHSSCSYFSNCD